MALMKPAQITFGIVVVIRITVGGSKFKQCNSEAMVVTAAYLVLHSLEPAWYGDVAMLISFTDEENVNFS